MHSFSSSSPWIGEPGVGGGAGGGGLRFQLPGGLFYSFNSFTFPFLLCVTFTYLLIYNRSGFFPFHCLVYGSGPGLCVPRTLRTSPSPPPPARIAPAGRAPRQLFSFTRLPSSCTFSSRNKLAIQI